MPKSRSKPQAKRKPQQRSGSPATRSTPAVAAAPVQPARPPRSERRSWLEGPEIAGTPGSYPGEGLGLPQTGPGSVAGLGRRFASILLDFVLCRLIAVALRPVWHGGYTDFVIYGVYAFLLTGFVGQTIAMRLFDLRLIGGGGRPPGPLWAFVRLLLTALIVPPFFVDNDRRGLHDRTAGTVVVLTEPGPVSRRLSGFVDRMFARKS